jgi:hypothetical protein
MHGTITAANRTDRSGAIFVIRLPIPLRPELRYEHSYNAPAYNLGTRKDQVIVAADVIFLY